MKSRVHLWAVLLVLVSVVDGVMAAVPDPIPWAPGPGCVVHQNIWGGNCSLFDQAEYDAKLAYCQPLWPVCKLIISDAGTCYFFGLNDAELCNVQEQCTPDGDNPLPLDMVWNTDTCMYEFNECHHERPMTSRPVAETGGSVGDLQCVSGCMFQMVREVLGVGHWASTDSACIDQVPPVGSVDQYAPPDGRQACLWDGSGNQACWEMEGTDALRNCGTVNGEWVCLDSIPDGACGGTPGGAAVCIGSAAPATQTPVDPDIEGEALDEDEQPAEFAFYSKDTINNAGSGYGAPGDAPGEGEDPSVPPDAIDPGTGGTEEPPITAEWNPQAYGEQATFAEVNQAFVDRVTASGLVGALNTAFGSFPTGGACPFAGTFELTAIGGTYSFAFACDLYDDIAPLISAVMLVAWSALGVVIVLRA